MRRWAVVVGAVVLLAGAVLLLRPRRGAWLREDRCLDGGGRVDPATGVCDTDGGGSPGVRRSGPPDTVPSPRAVVADLPRIDVEARCPDGATCDRTVEERVFATLDSLGDAALATGLSRDSVARILGSPGSAEGGRLSWRDLLWGNPVEVWTYAVSLSGTTAFVVVFVDGCVDAFGRMQQSWLWARWGRPGWSVPEAVEDYRFGGSGEPCGGA